MQLQYLALENFKGIRSYKIDAAGESLSIYGDNAAGKTTVFDAFLWLLFDKDSAGAKDFDIKPLDEAGAVRNHAAESTVFAVVTHDGIDTELKKVYREKWTKKRGAPEAEFDGNETRYYIDQLEVKKNQYQTRISEFCEESIFRLVTNPRQFAALKWDERRKILFEISGNIGDDEIIAATPELFHLNEARGRRSVDEFRSFCAQQRTNLNNQLKEIPIRISAIGQVSGAEGIEEEVEKKSISRLKVALATPEFELARMQNGTLAGHVENELEAAKMALQKLDMENRAFREKQQQEANAQSTKQTLALSQVLEKVQEKKNLLTRKKADEEARLSECARRRNTLLAEYQKLCAGAWTGGETCPCCGQTLPPERIEQSKSAFERQKAEGIAANKAAGMDVKRKISEIQTGLDDLNTRLETAEQFLSDTRQKLQDVPKPSSEPETDLPDYGTLRKALELKLSTIEEQKEVSSAAISARIPELSKQAEALREQISEHEQRLAKAKAAENARACIADLESQQKTVARQLDEAEQGLYLCDQFTRKKVSLVEESINSKFRMARFKLFDTQINGALVACCDATFEGVPYDALNNAAKINVGLDIICTLSKFYKFAAPVFIDNAESVTALYQLDAQIIRLIVSEPDKELRCEHDSCRNHD